MIKIDTLFGFLQRLQTRHFLIFLDCWSPLVTQCNSNRRLAGDLLSFFSKLAETVVISFYQARKIRVSLLLVLFFFSSAIPKSFALLGCSLGRQVFVPCRQLKFSRTLVLIQSFNRHAGGKLLPIHSLKWNQNDVFTACIVIIKGLASGFVYWSCALRHKPNINGLVVTWFHPPNWHPPLTRHFTFLIWNFLMKCS